MFSLSIRFSPNIFSKVLLILEAFEFSCRYVEAKSDFAGPNTPDAKSNISWFGYAIILNEKISTHRNKLAQYLISNSIEIRPIISGDFTKQPVIKKYLPKN